MVLFLLKQRMFSLFQNYWQQVSNFNFYNLTPSKDQYHRRRRCYCHQYPPTKHFQFNFPFFRMKFFPLLLFYYFVMYYFKANKEFLPSISEIIWDSIYENFFNSFLKVPSLFLFSNQHFVFYQLNPIMILFLF